MTARDLLALLQLHPDAEVLVRLNSFQRPIEIERAEFVQPFLGSDTVELILGEDE